MKHLASLLAALCLAAPATGFSHDWHGWSGRYCGPRVHFYGPWLPPLPFIAPYPYYGYYGPSASVAYSSDPAPTYRGARVDDQGDSLPADVQRALQHEGYYHGDIDGDIGAGTRAAIRQYQYDRHLEVTGRIDRALLQSLGMD